MISRSNQFICIYTPYLIPDAALMHSLCLATAYQKYQAFDKPMRMLSEGAKKVASGDFSVYLKPLNPPKHQNDVDRMFQDFNTMVTELGSIFTMKNDFIATVSHEFKTPLAIIQNYASALENEDLDPQTQREYLETLRHVFDKFYQGDSSHSKEGNGLGLALVRRVLELFHENITAESEVGRGSAFTVTLPRNNEKTRI